MSFEEFASSQLRPLLGLAIAMCGDKATAEDLVQDVLVKTHARWSHIERTGDPAAYLRRMLANEYISWRRKWARIVPSPVIAEQVVPVDFATTVVDRDLVAGLIADLPRQQQIVLALRYYGGLNDSEIASTLSCSAGTVRGYASRALATLRQRTAPDRHLSPTGGVR